MPTRTFISFRGEDEFKVWTLRGLAKFNNVSFDMTDVSLRNAIDSRDDSYIKSVVRPKIRSCAVSLCMIGENTHKSRKWIPWEISLAAEEGKRIIAMRFWDTPMALTPAVISNQRITPFNWDVDRLFEEIGW